MMPFNEMLFVDDLRYIMMMTKFGVLSMITGIWFEAMIPLG
jgi:hypothetical protein